MYPKYMCVFILRPLLFPSRGGRTRALSSDRKEDAFLLVVFTEFTNLAKLVYFNIHSDRHLDPTL